MITIQLHKLKLYLKLQYVLYAGMFVFMGNISFSSETSQKISSPVGWFTVKH